jgi:acyl-CoA dehydrogenase
VDFTISDDHRAIREAVGALCQSFGDGYWRELERDGSYPTAFVDALTEAGWLGVLIPEEYGGGGLGVTEAAIVLGEINRQGGNAASAHALIYIATILLRHGSDDLRDRYLRRITAGELRLQAFGVTEPDAGSDTTKISTRAVREGDRYVVNGQKVFISRSEFSDLMLLLARTAPAGEGRERASGLSLFLVELEDAVARGQIEIQPIRTMLNHHTTELFIRDLEVPAENLVGVEGEGFRHLLDGLNAERILVAAEAVGDGHWFIERAAAYSSERVIFGRPIGANQGIQFPIAQAHAALEAAGLLQQKAAWLFDHAQPCGAEANMAKMLGSQAGWAAANACLDTHGGYGFAEEYDVERKFRQTRLLMTAPISNNLVLAFIGQRVLGMPRSY